MFTIGLTGGIGSGKSTVSSLFASYGIEIIDADSIAREIVDSQQDVLGKITEKFGITILDGQKKLNRSALGAIIFTDSDKRTWLEELLHPLIRTEMQNRAKRAQSPYCIQVIPLLIEPDNYSIQRVLVIDAKRSEQIQRVIKRDKIPSTQARAILNIQTRRKQRLAIADDIIINNDNIEQLKIQVQKLHRLYLALANTSPS